jgi:hypothetical protein
MESSTLNFGFGEAIAGLGLIPKERWGLCAERKRETGLSGWPGKSEQCLFACTLFAAIDFSVNAPRPLCAQECRKKLE